jgi:phosphohistidine swiveling domain-containing protein
MQTWLGTPTYVLKAAQAESAGEKRVGGKAMGLARLMDTGAAVPWWTVLPTEAFERHISRAGLADHIRSELAGLTRELIEDVGAGLARLVSEAPIDPELAIAVETAIRGRRPLAVRSSVVGEDSTSGSYAGLFDSFLFLHDTESVLEAIKRCWGSVFNPAALAYRFELGEPLAAPATGVIVQEFVDGQVSGVVFTSNPVSERHDEALVSAAWGLGEGIVSGRCAADEYLCGHDGSERSATIADKDLQVAPAAEGTGTREIPVHAVRHKIRALEPQQVRELVSASLAVARALGRPQDIEWTLRDGRLVFLQARPITTTAPPSPLGRRRLVFDNSNIQESFNGVTTPLTFSVALRAYASVYEQTLRALGVHGEQLAAYLPVVRNMLGLVDGRVYYNINNWYRWLTPLPSFDRNKEDMEQMMGLQDPVDFIEGTSLTTLEKLRRLPAVLRVGLRLKREFRRIDPLVERFMARFEAQTAAIDRDWLATARLDELLALSDHVQREVVDRWVEPILNDIYVMTTAGRLRKLLERSRPPAQARELVTGLMSGEEAVASTEPTRRLMAVARAIRADAGLMHALSNGEPAEAFERLRDRSPQVRARLDEFVRLFGDRCMGEMKLETISVRQDPSFIVQILRNFVDQPELDVEALERVERQRREDFEHQATAGLGPWRRGQLRRAVEDARRGVAARERMRLARTRFVGLFRAIYLAAGERLHEADLLDDPRDVFYLTAEELEAFRDGTAVTTNLAALARLRKDEYAGYEDEEPPHHFETFGSPYHGERLTPARDVTAGNDRTLRGTGCSPGVVEAALHVVMSPHDDLDVGGKILTTRRTDPGWAPLFPTAAGLLIERGSILSHSAVLAREFGIPAVVGVPGLLDEVHHGDRVRLDGGAGIVERLERAGC